MKYIGIEKKTECEADRLKRSGTSGRGIGLQGNDGMDDTYLLVVNK